MTPRCERADVFKLGGVWGGPATLTPRLKVKVKVKSPSLMGFSQAGASSRCVKCNDFKVHLFSFLLARKTDGGERLQKEFFQVNPAAIKHDDEDDGDDDADREQSSLTEPTLLLSVHAF